jgi:hypothetical protein
MDDGAILQHAWIAGQLYLRNRSAAFCFEYAPDDIEGGSAVCVEIANRLFIATAAHNFGRLAQRPNWSAFAANRSSNNGLRILQANYRVGRRDDEPDVAWLEIDRESARDSDLVGINIEDLLLYPELYHGKLYLATGFPAGLKHVSAPNQDGHRDITIPFGIYFTTVVNAAEAAAAGGLIVLDYQRAGIDVSGQLVEVEPHGMSGGGVWYAPEDVAPAPVWDPRRLKLVGLSREYFRHQHRLTSEPMHIWLTLLRSDLPEMRDVIGPLLDG